MKQTIMRLISIFIFISFFAGAVHAETSETGERKSRNLLDRIDFGNSYIMGQSIKSGAVYLLQRKKSEIKSMLEYRTDYREEILEEFSVKKPEDTESDREERPAGTIKR